MAEASNDSIVLVVAGRRHRQDDARARVGRGIRRAGQLGESVATGLVGDEFWTLVVLALRELVPDIGRT